MLSPQSATGAGATAATGQTTIDEGLDNDALNALTRAVQAVGSDEFAAELLNFVNGVTTVDSCVVFTFAPDAGPGHLFTHGRMEKSLADSLAHDYVHRYHADDPNYDALASTGSEEAMTPLPLDVDYDPAYRNYFFDRVGLIDKAAAVGRVEVGNVYCNFYRMAGSGKYSADDRERLEQILPIATGLAACHYELVTARDPRRKPASSQSIVNTVIGRRDGPFSRLTDRERQVCERILLGYTSVGIGLDLDIAPSSVVTYRRRAYEKLGIATQNELFSLCLSAAQGT